MYNIVVCLTTGPKLLPNRAPHVVRSRASSFKWEYPLLSLRSSKSFLVFFLVFCHFYPPYIFSSITRCRRQFLRKMWPIQFAFRLRIALLFRKYWLSFRIILKLFCSCITIYYSRKPSGINICSSHIVWLSAGITSAYQPTSTYFVYTWAFRNNVFQIVGIHATTYILLYNPKS